MDILTKARITVYNDNQTVLDKSIRIQWINHGMYWVGNVIDEISGEKSATHLKIAFHTDDGNRFEKTLPIDGIPAPGNILLIPELSLQ